MTNEKLYTKPTEEEYDEVKELTKTNKKILKYSILTIIIILVTIMHFGTIINIINSTMTFIGNVFKYIFIENINTVKQLSFVAFILLTNALLLIHVKTLKHVSFKRHRPNYLKKYSNTKFWGKVYSFITIPLLYLVYGTFTQFLTILLVVSIPVSIYTYISINKIEKLYPKLPNQTKEQKLLTIKYFNTIKTKSKKHFGTVYCEYLPNQKKQIKELNIALNFNKFILDYNKYNEYKVIVEKTNTYIRESIRSYNKFEKDDNKSYHPLDYGYARDNINFEKLKKILNENKIPIINYIQYNYTPLKIENRIHNRIKVIIKNNIFY